MFIKPHSYSDDYSNRSFPLSKSAGTLVIIYSLILGYSTTLASSGNSFSVFHSALTSLYTSHSSDTVGTALNNAQQSPQPVAAILEGRETMSATKGILIAVDLAVRNAREEKNEF